MDQNPKFFSLFLESLKFEYDVGGIRYLVPYVLLLCLGTGFFLGFYFLPILNQHKESSFFPLLAALVTAQGIILATSTQTAGIIFNNINKDDFAIFLKKNNFLNHYVLFVQFIQTIHIFSLLFLLGTSLIYFVREDFSLLFKLFFSLSFGTFLYAMRWTWLTSVTVRDLIYHRSTFESLEKLKKELERDEVTR